VGQTAITHGHDEMIGGLKDNWIKQPEHVALLLSGIDRVRHASGKNIDDAIIVIGLPARQYTSEHKAYQSAIAEYMPRAEFKVITPSVGP
jgi:hypothetical protein